MISTLLLILILINTIFFFVLLIRSVLTNNSEKYSSITKAETAILSIAFTQYLITFVIENSNVLDKDANIFAQQLRYADWLITTPLLLYTYWELAKVEGYDGDFFLIFIMDFVMIVCGILGEIIYENTKASLIFFAIGAIAFIVIIVKIIDIMNFFNNKNQINKRNLGWYFLLGWVIYPASYFFNDNTKFILYSIGDFINKGLYSITLSEIISKN